MIEFILARYNYWIVIALMMIGLYIVFSRGNLVKTIIGLNVFQTSVFIFYITIGKVAGGTAPILIQSKVDKAHGDHPSDDHGEGPTGGAHHDDTITHHAEGHADPLTQEEAAAFVSGDAANALPLNQPGSTSEGRVDAGETLHTLPGLTPSNTLQQPDLLNTPVSAPPSSPAAEGVPDISLSIGQEPPHVPPSVEGHGVDTPIDGGHAADAVADVIYSNPLPHVLILTAIVVGVATTAVGLSIAVRIREAYGTVEEDTLEQIDNAAEFGPSAGEALSR